MLYERVTPMRNVKQDLANFSKQTVPSMRMGRLEKMYSKRAEDRREKDLRNEGKFRVDVALVEQIKSMIANALEEDANQPIRGSLPVNSVFDALQIVNSCRELKRDAGLKALKGHLETKWKKDREANISADDFTQIKDRYTRNYPRSVVGSVIDEIGKRGYVTLPLSDLMGIAGQVNDQQDFDRLMVDYGLHTSQPHHIKARNFILSVIHNKQEQDR